MATFAAINQSNVVTQVTELSDQVFATEEEGALFLHSLIGGRWVQTFNLPPETHPYPRGSYASIGSTYDPELDVFEALTLVEGLTNE